MRAAAVRRKNNAYAESESSACRVMKKEGMGARERVKRNTKQETHIVVFVAKAAASRHHSLLILLVVKVLGVEVLLGIDVLLNLRFALGHDGGPKERCDSRLLSATARAGCGSLK